MKIAELEPGIEAPFALTLAQHGAVNMGAFTLPKLVLGRAVDGTKPYQKGDPVRFIDWHSYARTDKLYSREKVETTRVGIEIYVDGGESMAFPSGEAQGPSAVAKLNVALRLGYFLGYELAALGEQVTLCFAYGDQLAGLFTQCSDRKLIKSQFAEQRGQLDDPQRVAETALHGDFVPARQTQKFRLVISDGLSLSVAEWLERLGGARGASSASSSGLFIHCLSHLELDLSWLAPDDVYFESGPQRKKSTGSSFRTYAASVAQQREAWLQESEETCRSQGWGYLQVHDGFGLDEFLAAFGHSVRQPA